MRSRPTIFLICLTSFACGSRFAAAQSFTTLPSRAEDESGFVYTASPADWRDVPIYQILTDRFYDGDPANNDDNPDGDTDPAGLRSIHGGDFEGAEAKLNYIQMLGARGIWISPVVRNVNGEFHGFSATDFNAIDPHWGTLEDLRSFIDAAHARNMYVLIDVVQNHAGDLITSGDPGFPSFDLGGYNMHWIDPSRRHAPPFDDLARFYNHGRIENWNDPVQVLLGDFFNLDGINTERADVRQDMITIYQALIGATDCDGFRVDTARHVEMAFWETFLPAIQDYCASIGKSNFLVYAEAWVGSDSSLSPYTGTNRFNSVLHFPLRDTLENVFVWGSPTSIITDRLNNLSLYDPAARDQLVQFVDNHDMARTLSGDKLSGNDALLQAALSFLYTSGRVPALYYGTEQGFNGGGDPYDREDMFDGEFEFGPSLGDNFNFTHPLYRYVRTLHLFRQAYPALARGDLTMRWQTSGGRGLYVYSMKLGSKEAIVAINTSNQPQDALSGGIGPQTFQAQGTVMANLFDLGETVTVGQGGGTNRITFSVPGYGTKIWVPQADVVPLPPTVASMSPGHDVVDVARAEPITVTFDQPMNAALVEAAFTTEPATSGSFTWDAPDRVTYTPALLWDTDTRYTVRIDAAAESANGDPLGAMFESHFVTGSAIIPIEEVPLREYDLDGSISPVEATTLRASANGVDLYVDFNGKQIYVATVSAANGADRFIFVTTDPTGMSAAPWVKSGQVAGLQHYLGNEVDNGWSGWFIGGSVDGSQQSTSVQGGWLEGILDPPAAFGQIPSQLYVATVPYQTSNGGSLVPGGQVPDGNADGNLDSSEYFLLDVASFDTDGDGLPDLHEDANADGVVDPGETRPLAPDSDGDGMTDGEEYAAGTDPNDSLSFFAIADMMHVGGQIFIHWIGLTGHVYTVRVSPDFSGQPGTWVVTQIQDEPGSGALMEFSEDVSSNSTVRAFRVEVSRQP